MAEFERLPFWPFMWRSVYRAGADSVAFFGWDLKTALTATLLLLFGLGVYTQVKGLAAAKDQVADLVLLSVIPSILFLSGLFLISLVRAPYGIYVEEHGRAAALLAQSEQGRLTAQKAADDAKGALDEAQRRQATVVAPPAASSPAAPSNHNEVLKRLADYLYKFENLERLCIEKRGSDEVSAASTKLYNEVSVYLRESLGVDFAARFKAATGNGVQINYPSTKSDLLGRIRGRKQFLIDTMRDLRR